MPTVIPSFAKINLGLYLGAPEVREDGFHELRTVYQTIDLADSLRITVKGGTTDVRIKCADPRVPLDESNTCHKVALRVLKALKTRAQVTIEIDKKLPTQGGMGAASGNAASTILGLERELKQRLPAEERLRIAEEVGSDIPLFLVGGTVLGTGRGEQVFPLADLPPLDLVVVTPKIAVSTPQAFRDWDALFGKAGKLTVAEQSSKLSTFSREVYAWLVNGSPTGVAAKGSDRAEALLLDLVRTGIENDFERVVFPQFPELRDIKRALERSGAKYCALSGSGSTLFGIYGTAAESQAAAKALQAQDFPAQATVTLPREQYWQRLNGK